NCTTHFKDDGDVEIWVPTQSPSGVYDVAKNIAQSKIERKLRQLKNDILGGYDDTINVNTTYLGGGFGRRLQHDYVSESVQISKRYKHPVQHVWSREEDLKQDYFHPLTLHDISVCLDDQGYPLAWHHIIKGGGVNAIGADHLYDIPNKKIEVLNGPEYLRKGSWRSVGAHYNVYVIEHLIDELALQSNYDPIEYRLNLLRNSSRLSKVIETVAEFSGWSERANEEYIYGIAAARTFGSYVAEVVMLKKIKENSFKLHKVFCVVDCGVVVNPDIVKQQMEGGIVWGLTAATKSKITVKNCQVEQKNFYNYPIIRLNEVPSIEVHIMKSSENPEGIGEPGVPPLAPAIANAVLTATGRSSYELPIRMS
ncbi:MAG: molybdopterin cofactor-binding domain-containing protein, partial [Candidatus Thiodiazotropha taylori]